MPQKYCNKKSMNFKQMKTKKISQAITLLARWLNDIVNQISNFCGPLCLSIFVKN